MPWFETCIAFEAADMDEATEINEEMIGLLCRNLLAELPFIPRFIRRRHRCKKPWTMSTRMLREIPGEDE